MFTDDGLATFQSVRPRLFYIAFRMLHSAAEAEDLVQDVWVRWQQVDRSLVRDPVAFLTTTMTRLAINVVQSARTRREMPVGPWLEPIDVSADPRIGMERGQALAGAVGLLLENLTDAERTAFILREAFEYRYRDIANILHLEEAHARQLVTRARMHVATRRKRRASSSDKRRLLDAFMAAAKSGDIAGLLSQPATLSGH
jgi:RNA polymerase sigma-70 factor, ECF subfamily